MRRSYWIIAIVITLAIVATGCGSQPEGATPTVAAGENNPLAAVQTMAASTTLVPPTPVGGVAVKGPDDYVGLVRQAWSIVEAEYVWGNFNGADWDAIYDEYTSRAEEVTSSEELWDLLTEMILELDDDHSRFVPPDRLGRESGVETNMDPEPVPTSGLVFWPGPAREHEYLTVWDVCTQSAAAQAGITRGDIILAIDNNPVEMTEEGITREDAGAAVVGTGGESVTLTVWKGPDLDPVDITLTLGGIGGCPYRYHGIVLEDPRIGYIRVPDFDGDSDFAIHESIKAMEEEQPLAGLIVDVRHNPGGNSDNAVAVFTEGVVGTVGKYREGEQRTIYRIRGPVLWNENTPVVVLTDGASHSAADYFPAAMKELDRATIVGMNSAGNTDGHTGFILSDGTLIRLAVMSMALNDGTNLEGIGVTPDVIVPLGTWGLKAEPYDLQIQAGIDTLIEMIQ